MNTLEERHSWLVEAGRHITSPLHLTASGSYFNYEHRVVYIQIPRGANFKGRKTDEHS